MRLASTFRIGMQALFPCRPEERNTMENAPVSRRERQAKRAAYAGISLFCAACVFMISALGYYLWRFLTQV